MNQFTRKYHPRFLGTLIELPALSDQQVADVAPVKGTTNNVVIK